MTGEMGYEDLKDYPYWFELAKKIRDNTEFSTAVKPFDVYQGAFIAVRFERNGKFFRDGRKLTSWNIAIWGSESPNFWFVERRTPDFAGYEVREKDIYKVLRAIAKHDFISIEKYEAPYTD